MPREDCNHLQRFSRRFAARAGVSLWLVHNGYPRLAVAGVVVFSALFGAASSVWLRHWGLSALWLRYPLAFVLAYGAFLGFLGLLTSRVAWRLDSSQDHLRRTSQRHQTRSDYCRPRELSDLLNDLPGMSNEVRASGDPRAVPAYLMLMVSITVIVVCGYFIWIAPTLLAELVVEGALIPWLYRPTPRGGKDSWLTVALEQTGAPALVMAICFLLAGAGLQLYAPRAESVVDVWQHAEQLAAQKAIPARGFAGR